MPFERNLDRPSWIPDDSPGVRRFDELNEVEKEIETSKRAEARLMKHLKSDTPGWCPKCGSSCSPTGMALDTQTEHPTALVYHCGSCPKTDEGKYQFFTQDPDRYNTMTKTTYPEIDYDWMPPSMKGPARRYIEDRIAPGSFLVAVFSNNLVAASQRADLQNFPDIGKWGSWLLTLPTEAWGSSIAVDAWLHSDSTDLLETRK